MEELQTGDLTPDEEAKLLLISDDMKIEYDGSYPNLCSGTLRVTVGPKIWDMQYVLFSGGGLDKDYEAYSGPWSLDNLPKDFPENLREKLLELVNDQISWGCCGGCS